MAKLRRREISIDFEGVVYGASYTVEANVVTLTWVDNSGGHWCEHRATMADSEFEARRLFNDVLAAAKERGFIPR